MIRDILKLKRICVIGAHTDDVELGMGGTLNQIRREFVEVIICSNSMTTNPEWDTQKECRTALSEFDIVPTILNYQTRYFDKQLPDLRDNIYQLKDKFDVFFTHSNT